MRNAIDLAFQKSKVKRRPLLISYTVCGDPNKKKSLERLKSVQQKLLNNQIKMNKSLENTTINVLVENRTKDKSKLFGRSQHMTSVLFNGSDDLIGKIVKVKIQSSNRNTLFGETEAQLNQKVA